MLNAFFQSYESVSSSSGSDGFPSRCFKPCCSYPDVNKLVCELKEQLETIFSQEINKTVQKGKLAKGYFFNGCVWLYLSLRDDIGLYVLPVSDLAVKNNPVGIKFGDRVRVKPSVKTPKYNWGGGITHKSVGVVKGMYYSHKHRWYIVLQCIPNEHVQHAHLHVLLSDIKSDEILVIDFPGFAGWKGLLSEMELVTDDGECGKYTEQNTFFSHLISSYPSKIKWGEHFCYRNLMLYCFNPSTVSEAYESAASVNHDILFYSLYFRIFSSQL